MVNQNRSMKWQWSLLYKKLRRITLKRKYSAHCSSLVIFVRNRFRNAYQSH
nr:hypothetical protein Iba_chr11aCG12760 [Ipomoea batatas]GMD52505.1 hypothetical protein Iba_chr11bCG12260 [Ipomoea batatas]GME05351.1 hypothetical protein Iba_scaffold2820CG0030 [Ipomoea batatas]